MASDVVFTLSADQMSLATICILMAILAAAVSVALPAAHKERR